MEDKHREVVEKIVIKCDESDMETCHLLIKSSKTVICFVNKKFYLKILARNSELSDLN